VAGDLLRTRDLSSRNGTYLNGEAVSGEQILRTGDRVRYGEVEFRVFGSGSSAEVTRASTSTLDDYRGLGLSAMVKSLGARPAKSSAEDRLRLLLRVSQLLNEPGDADELRRRAVELTASVLRASRVVVLLEENGALGLSVTNAESEGDGQIYSNSVVNGVFADGQAALFRDTQLDERLQGVQSVLLGDIRSCMAAPLMVSGATIGVLYVDSLVEVRAFDQTDLDLLIALANQVALALHHERDRLRLQEEERLRRTLVRFFPPATARRLLERRTPESEVILCSVTVLFADISEFTSMSARLDPRDVVRLLNKFFPPMAEIVFGLDGTLEKYIGDALFCGTGHVVKVWTLWNSDYVAGAVLDLATFLVSVPAAIGLGLTIWQARLSRNAITQAEERAQSAEASSDGLLERLQATNADLERFAYAASHDLQEPLRAIESYTALLREDYEASLDAQGASWLGSVERSASRAQRMVEELLAFSRLSTEGREFATVPLRSPVDEALARLELALADADAEVTVRALPSVHADAAQLALVFQNLIGNALKYRGDRPARVEIVGERVGARVRVRVLDEGVGIPEASRHKVFEVFGRLHSEAQVPGTGLGLAMCRRVLERHTGTIAVVDSADGRTCIEFDLAPAEEA
jgi:signal transduction histidine kinase